MNKRPFQALFLIPNPDLLLPCEKCGLRATHGDAKVRVGVCRLRSSDRRGSHRLRSPRQVVTKIMGGVSPKTEVAMPRRWCVGIVVVLASADTSLQAEQAQAPMRKGQLGGGHIFGPPAESRCQARFGSLGVAGDRSIRILVPPVEAHPTRRPGTQNRPTRHGSRSGPDFLRFSRELVGVVLKVRAVIGRLIWVQMAPQDSGGPKSTIDQREPLPPTRWRIRNVRLDWAEWSAILPAPGDDKAHSLSAHGRHRRARSADSQHGCEASCYTDAGDRW